MHFFKAPSKIHRVELTKNEIHCTNVLAGWSSTTANPSKGAATLMMYEYDKVVIVCHTDGTVLWEMAPYKMDALSIMITDGMEWNAMTHMLQHAK